MAKRYFINGIEVNEPINWADFEMSIVREHEMRIILEEFDEQLRFNKQAYDILKDLICNSICSTTEIRVFSDCLQDEEYRGIILLSECEFSDCEVSVKIRNESLFYKIDANKDIKHYAGTTITPNGTEIPAVKSVEVKGVTMYRLDEIIAHTISFVTDGAVAFKSSFLSTY